MRTLGRRVITVLIIIGGLLVLVEACVPELTFRAYLSPDFFQPLGRGLSILTRVLPAEKNTYIPYAGISESPDAGPMAGLRAAYRDLLYNSPPQVGPYGQRLPLVFLPQAVDAVRDRIRAVSPLNGSQADEVDLLQCKLDLRAARIDDDPSLLAAQTCLEGYLQRTRPAALRSEARGWLARTYFLRRNRAEAAKIYLDELESPDSNIKRARLLTSLKMVYSSPPRAEDLSTFFDTPSHALYAANLATNASTRYGGDSLNRTVLAGLEEKKSLFREGPQSDALAMSQMRAALRLGDPDAILRFASLIPAASDSRRAPNYLWLTGSAHFLKGNYPQAEQLFLELFDTSDAEASERARAGEALEGVYERMGRPVDQLWAAFRVVRLGPELEAEFREKGLTPAPIDGVGINLDVAFLLDAQLTDRELQQYLDRYGNSPLIFGNSSAGEVVRYARAVRHARKEEFAAAAQIYSELGAALREAGAREAARLFTATRTPGNAETQMQALYAYADFLASNPNGVFFNDRLWWGFQRAAFTTLENHAFPKPPAERLPQVQELERKLQDDQEEYWRAYKILNGIVSRAGPTPLGKQSARRAIVCLRKINTGRFGRLEEIQAADRRLSSWLERSEGSPKR
jgi:hypothetical protein